MDFLSYEKRLAYLLELVTKGRLRSLDDVAGRFDCSTRTVKRMINHLRDQGHQIQYDRLEKKYFLKKDE
ncbi:DeoR family transcriptional regulator [Mucilaginibacter sp. SJ]|uniref:DeoR family transcriptional regulator n=1 Tax=Mucilaginibacter sp. SJ TaxID=3029053 RepID=UPI0023A91E01|nr:HTH domain-containing protein [Mucilaginibacter sp. SJ]WEA01748.1 HTH domain-containing protein [Mucilaginibacter sp. SJ]